MEKINFENLPSAKTPVNATNLNKLQKNIEDTLIESGSNDNGTWIKFPNGDMICFNSVSVRSGDIINLPNSFINKNFIVIFSCGYNTTPNVIVAYGDKTPSNFRPYFTIDGAYNNTLNQPLDYMAVGKWK